MISINYTHFQIKHWNMLYHVHTCIAIFFHISYNPVSTHSINQNNYYKLCFTKTVETLTYQAQKNFHTISDFTKCCWLVMLVVGLIDIQHMQAVIKGFFFFQKLLLFSDLEIQWPRNPWDFACLQHLSEGVSHSIEEKKSQLCFRATKLSWYI